MRRLSELAPLALLVACVTDATLDQHAADFSTPLLCYGERSGNPEQKQAATRELARRGVTCTDADVQKGIREWEGRLPSPDPRRGGY